MAKEPQSNHPLTYPDGVWTCPQTGISVPVGSWEENCHARMEILASGDTDRGACEELYWACSQSIVLWSMLFGWTYRLREILPDGTQRPTKNPHAPFILWPVQTDAIQKLVDCVQNGKDALIDKSRDMGASWMNCLLATWYWLFEKESQILLVSRIEDLVDRRGDPDSLMWKIDYMLASCPSWMLPCEPDKLVRGGNYRQHMQLVNPKTGATISGQATTAHIGRGGRRTFVLFDEMASMSHAGPAWQSAADTTSCRIANSTPIGAGTEFTKLRNEGVTTGNPIVITLGYWDHPEKGYNREWAIDEGGLTTGTANRGYWSTPWFMTEIKRRHDVQDVGQNILIDHTTSGDLFFPSDVVTRHVTNHAKDALRCEMEESNGKWVMVPDPRGRWYVWEDLEDGLPRIDTVYCMFADLSHGSGSSNSAVAVLDSETGTFVAEFVDPYISTHDLASEVCLAGREIFSGQTEEAFLGWEVNGPGESWYEDIRRNDYRYVYYKRALGKKGGRRTRDYGWRSDRRSKRILLSALSRAMLRGDITVPCKRGLLEMLEYIFFDDGSIGPGYLRDELSGARESHGDRVVAYAGCVFLRAEAPHFESPSVRYKPGSLGEVLNHAEIWDEI